MDTATTSTAMKSEFAKSAEQSNPINPLKPVTRLESKEHALAVKGDVQNDNTQDSDSNDTSIGDSVELISERPSRNRTAKRVQTKNAPTRKSQTAGPKGGDDSDWEASKNKGKAGKSIRKRGAHDSENQVTNPKKKSKTTRSDTTQSKSHKNKSPAKAGANKTAATGKKTQVGQKMASKATANQKNNSTAQPSQSKSEPNARSNEKPTLEVKIPPRNHDTAVDNPKEVRKANYSWKDAGREQNASFNIDDQTICSEFDSLTAKTEQLFVRYFEDDKYSEQMDAHRAKYCRQLLIKLPETISLVVGIDDMTKGDERYSKLNLCLRSDMSVMPIQAWKMVHALFFAFLTSDILLRKDLMNQIGFDDWESAQAIRKYHMDTEKDYPLQARRLRNLWRQTLRRRLNTNTEKAHSLADRLMLKFMQGIHCFFLQGLDSEDQAQADFTRALKSHINSVIHLRARMHLSSFQYRLSWIAVGRGFDFRDMITDYQEGSTSENHLNSVRVARSPTIEVRRPNRSNDNSWEACEFSDEDFGEWEMVRQGSVVCFDGRVSRPPLKG